MAERHVTVALRRKYAELKGLLATLPIEEADQTILDIRRVGWVLRMFNPEENLPAIKPIRPSFGRGRAWTRDALDILRREGRAMTAREIARQIIVQRRLKADPKMIASIECSLHASLARHEGDSVKRLASMPKRWSIAG